MHRDGCGEARGIPPPLLLLHEDVEELGGYAYVAVGCGTESRDGLLRCRFWRGSHWRPGRNARRIETAPQGGIVRACNARPASWELRRLLVLSHGC